ncbi:oxidoreductase, NAD-binding Rossmann fold family protein [Ehrlichia chaffeensis str. Heartland]|uniref:Pyrroline-5-carboxylate reductase n=1 Tax=Ehrlichia chaffeensis (strain ATCC CRL-10679 / Arkansas) TaxID=205920 RepID=Q2GI85_EHRCR|nr:pyrroline-5-carboxylate reductase dimerization domain-containing protein [Ehrlichia chaffeensis]ABD44806.1 putative pyrroline-5-carboxylate reductase [Ehrlichia chaffeensis str. Arkansas]AHX03196.1 oxidoreductase, NAD-binding Rossmann fold family protein [Ehrlichia chaffeensis str. Heartland]AHX05112.1 oxidoreductase, NAD-binding Rossmann fold family protein [Ehrlichia chaffeensis str. Jax]AHX06101.1 oxidoreductase, NAD-binding Rossmann fold family protein [Ehrlichia chaffeensis str. Liberty
MNILLIGCGNLGSILLNKWSHSDQISKVTVVQPSLSKKDTFNNITKVVFVKSHEEVDKDFIPQIVVIAIKPQLVSDVMPNYRIYSESASFISLCAGIDINFLKTCLSPTATIIRVMPNIAMSLGKSVNLSYIEEELPHEKQKVSTIFNNTGLIYWIQKEDIFDKLSPITGSGPAYFFSLAEELVKNTIAAGINEEDAIKLVSQTFIGSAKLLETRQNTISHLISSITSRGGITQAALQVLNLHLPQTISSCLKAAMERLLYLKGLDKNK